MLYAKTVKRFLIARAASLIRCDTVCIYHQIVRASIGEEQIRYAYTKWLCQAGEIAWTNGT